MALFGTGLQFNVSSIATTTTATTQNTAEASKLTYTDISFLFGGQLLDAEIRFSESLLVQSIGKDHHFRSLAPITLSEPNGSVGKSHSSTNVNIQTIILQKKPKNVTYLTAHFILRGDEFILLSVCRKNGLSRVYDKFNEFPSSYLRFFRQTASYLFKATTDHYIIVDKGFTCSPSLPVFSRLDEEQINQTKYDLLWRSNLSRVIFQRRISYS